MSLDAEIAANAASQGAPEESQGVPDVSAEVEAALEKDPQRKLARQVQKDLEEAGLTDATGNKPDEAPTEAPQTDEEFKAEKARIAQALAKRSQTFKEREAARLEADTIRAEAQRMKQEAEQFAAQVRAEAARAAQFQRMLKENPAQAMRMAGLDPEEFIYSLAKEGTPEGQLERQLREQKEELSEFKRWKQELAEREARAKQDYEQRMRQQYRSQIENEFIGLASQADKFSNVSKALESGLISKRSLISEGDEIADRYREATGQEASAHDILEYIDSQVAQAISKLGGTSQVKVPQTPGTKPAPGANGQKPTPKVGKTLSADDASERRALERDLTDADSDERREAARQAVRAVLNKAAKKE